MWFQVMAPRLVAAAFAVCVFAQGASAQDDMMMAEEEETVVYSEEAPAAEVEETYGEETREEKYEKRNNSYTVMLNQDAFFGFYPTFNGLIGGKPGSRAENIYFSFYGILWTKPAFGFTENSGDNLWGEFGVGASFALLDDRLFIKPQFGMTNGALLSGGSRDTPIGTLVADGIVPSLTVNWSEKWTEAEIYLGYYMAARQRNDDTALDFLHFWANVGVKIFPAWSIGFHYELLRNTRNTYDGGSTGNTYAWLGAYTQFNLPKGFFARFTAGADTVEGRGDFYKIGVGMSF